MAFGLARRLVAGVVVAAMLAPTAAISAPAKNRDRSIPLLRDAEAEALIGDYARPILKAAGLGGAEVRIRIVNDDRFNAFVADGRNIFINAGTIMQTETPNEMIGVLAHETGHLAAGHLAQLREALRDAQIMSIIAMLGGAAAAAAGGGGRGMAAAALGGNQIAERSLLSYQRGQERSADHAAVTYLDKTGQSGAGMLAVFDRLAGQQLFVSRYGDPYVQSHPFASDRIAQLEEIVRKSKNFSRTDSAELQARHDLVRAKFIGFMESPQKVARLYPDKDTSLPAAYARAVVAYRLGSPKAAVAHVDDLIRRDPKNPWFLELKGQILTETGTPGAAIEPLRRAVALAPRSGFLKVMLGHAQVASGDDRQLKEAIENLNRGLADDPFAGIGYRQLAIAYARTGNIPMADLATAQGYFAVGDVKNARQYAARAQASLKRGTPAWLRADDIASYKPPRL